MPDELIVQPNVVEELPDAMVDKNTTYNGNPLLKREHSQVAMTQEHLDELKKCMDDPIYFAEKYIKIVHVDKGLIPIKLYDYQKRMIRAMTDNRFSIVLSCRQSGKCVAGDTMITVQNDNYNDGKPFKIKIKDLMKFGK